MITRQELMRAARDSKLNPALLEKDYVLGWALYGISQCSLGEKLAFKGGTALSKVFFPSAWRISEDLDFTSVGEMDTRMWVKALREEVPSLVGERSRIAFSVKGEPHVLTHFMQLRLRYAGPISQLGNTVKVEICKESFLGDVEVIKVPRQAYPDYPDFKVQAYTLDNILAEKLRAILQRGKIRDYYDVWKLTRSRRFDGHKILGMFQQKCEGKNVTYHSVQSFFPPDIAERLRPYVRDGLTRLSPEPLPTIEDMLNETRDALASLLE